MLTNPILSNKKFVIYYAAAWILIAGLYLILLHFGLGLTTAAAIADSVVFNSLLAGLGLSLWYPARFISFDQKKAVAVSSHIIGGFFTSILWLVIGYLLITRMLGFSNDYPDFFASTIIWRFLIGTLFYYMTVSFYYMIFYYNESRDSAVKEAELKSLVNEAELKTLKFQINPHFIFNSLNSISALTEINPKRAKDMILKLADFLRYTLANNEKQTNKLSEELKNINRYLEIEKIRFEGRFEYIEDINKECAGIQIPNMILQPLFENAIKHAVYEALDKVTINLSCRREGDYMKISLKNNFEENGGSKRGTGIGLQNIKNRLELIYNNPSLLDIKKDDKLFTVNLYIPLEGNPSNKNIAV